MDGHDRPGSLGDSFFDLVRIDLEGLRIGIGKDRQGTGAETMTSSPTPTSRACIAVSRELVPLTVQTHLLAPSISAYAFSNFVTVSPLPRNQFPLRRMDMMPFSADLSQIGQLWKGLVLTALPPLIASLPALLPA